MERNFDEIIKSSLKQEFDNLICPDTDSELEILKLKLKQKKRIIRMKTYASICAIFLVIPLIFFIYYNKEYTEEGFSKNSVVAKSRLNLINESSLIIHGEVKGIESKNSEYNIKIDIKDTLKGIPYSKNIILIKTNDKLFDIDENVILFLSKENIGQKTEEGKYYILTGASLGKYLLKEDSNIFVNYDSSDKVKLSTLKDEILKSETKVKVSTEK